MTSSSPDRRALILGVGALALGGSGGGCATPRGPASVQPFTLGVASGEPAPSGFVIWTRLAPDPLAPDGSGGLGRSVDVRWEIAADDAFRSIVAEGRTLAEPALGHSVHVEVGGLRPDRPYWYRFTALGARSAAGSARTAPAPDARPERLRIAFASCSHWEKGWFSAYRHMAAERPDLVLFLGDYIYEYSHGSERAAGLVRRHDRSEEVVNLAGYRNRYALYRTDPDLQALHACAPCLVTWDDHEVQNDYAGALSQNRATDPATFLRRRAAAYQAFYEHMPLRRRAIPRGPKLTLHTRVRWGDLAEFTVLDGRQYRSPAACPTPASYRARVVGDNCLERLDSARTMLGFEQERWLSEGFRRSTSRWNLLAQNVIAAPLRQTGRDGTVGHWTDAWDGYPATRERVLAAMTQTRLSNPVFLGGDIHAYFATELKENADNPDSRTVATEFVGTSVTADGPPQQAFVDMLPENPHVRFFEGRQRGYVSADIGREAIQVRFQAISDREDRKATVTDIARFTVQAGKPGLVAA